MYQPHTEFRIAMLANGYWPLVNKCKRPVERGWSKKRPTEAALLAWDRSTFNSTGMKIDGDLAVVDADVTDIAMMTALADAVDRECPALFRCGLVRHTGGVKEAWFTRVDEPFARVASRRWYRGDDPDDPGVPKHLVECFASAATRQFAVDGPHAIDDRGEVIDVYQFVGGASPATMPRATLPVLPKALFPFVCNVFDQIAEAAGLTAVKRSSKHAVRKRFELDADTEIETQDYGTKTVAKLEEFLRSWRRDGETAYIRCSGTFHDATRVRRDSHLVGIGRYGISIYDTMTESTWHRRDRAPCERYEFLLRERNPFQ
jgi:hypothetical protein